MIKLEIIAKPIRIVSHRLNDTDSIIVILRKGEKRKGACLPSVPNLEEFLLFPFLGSLSLCIDS